MVNVHARFAVWPRGVPDCHAVVAIVPIRPQRPAAEIVQAAAAASNAAGGILP
jgi:hypothetical protein